MGAEFDSRKYEIEPSVAKIEQALWDGHSLHVFQSESGLREVRIENSGGDIVGYGEAPQVDVALAHAALDYRLGHELYDRQYSDENARYAHISSISIEDSSALDEYLRRGAIFYARKTKKCELIEATFSGINYVPEVPNEIKKRVIATRIGEEIKERGVLYRIIPNQIPGSSVWGIEPKVIKNKYKVDTEKYFYTKTGHGLTFAAAVADAFEAPEIELM